MTPAQCAERAQLCWELAEKAEHEAIHSAEFHRLYRTAHAHRSSALAWAQRALICRFQFQSPLGFMKPMKPRRYAEKFGNPCEGESLNNHARTQTSTLGEFLHQLRIRAELTLSNVARLTGFPPRTVASYEATVRPRPERFGALLAIYSASPAERLAALALYTQPLARPVRPADPDPDVEPSTDPDSPTDPEPPAVD